MVVSVMLLSIYAADTGDPTRFLTLVLSMIFPENWFPLFGIMLCSSLKAR
jgi:hypothetical protein